jgi:shikimate kinase
MKHDKIYLVGFMGAGKTTLGKALARRLDWRVEDIDESIESVEHSTVAEIFSTRGEAYFRAAERGVVRRLLHLRHTVVATGSGTYVDLDNRASMNADGVTIWLDIPCAIALERVPADGRRPLANDRTQFEALYARRRLAYQQAHLRVDAGRPTAELVERILDRLGY